jgi:hypothetical protein
MAGTGTCPLQLHSVGSRTLYPTSLTHYAAGSLPLRSLQVRHLDLGHLKLASQELAALTQLANGHTQH